jgi:hypothetical protein
MAENDYTTVAFVLGLIAGILILVAGALLSIIFGAVGTAAVSMGAAGLGAVFWILAIVGLVSGIVVIVGSVMLRSPEKRVVGSVLVLIFSIIAIFTAGGGLLIGSILGIVGGILGLVSKPGAATTTTEATTETA